MKVDAVCCGKCGNELAGLIIEENKTINNKKGTLRQYIPNGECKIEDISVFEVKEGSYFFFSMLCDKCGSTSHTKV